MNHNASDIVPFGKYKGKPIEAMAQDEQYVQWLLEQPWFQQKHGNLYQIVINNFCEPSNTPEHNSMQARFLDGLFICRLLSIVRPQFFTFATNAGVYKFIYSLCDKANYYIDHRDYHMPERDIWDHIHKLLTKEWRPKAFPLVKIDMPLFEHDGLDVQIYASSGIRFLSDEFTMSIEIKPTIGDDYPSILRQMKRSKANYSFTSRIHRSWS